MHRSPESLWFFRCVFDASPRFDGARIAGSLSFPGCLLPGLRAEDCTIAGDLALNAGCTVRLDVRLARTTVGRNLNLGRAQLRSGDRVDMQVPLRLVADDARIAGDALLTDGFEADGDVRLVGLRVVGDLRASSARLSGHVNGDGQRGDALNLDLAHVAGNVVLDKGFSAAGSVRLRRAQIDGDLDCTQAAFDAFNDMGWRGAVAFAIDRARIGGSLVLARLKQPLSRATLSGASVGTLHDDDTSWGESLVLDGFAYRQLAAPAPASSGFRIEWLSRQEPSHMGRDFRAQPWHQLIRVFQRMGLPAAARDVAVAREVQLRRVGRVGARCPAAAALAAAVGAPRVRAARWLRPSPVAAGGGDAAGVAWLRGGVRPCRRTRRDRAHGVVAVATTACSACAAKPRPGDRLDAVRGRCRRSTRRSTRCPIRSSIWCRSSICSSAVCGRWPANARHPRLGHGRAHRDLARGGAGLGRLGAGRAVPDQRLEPPSRRDVRRRSDAQLTAGQTV